MHYCSFLQTIYTKSYTEIDMQSHVSRCGEYMYHYCSFLETSMYSLKLICYCLQFMSKSYTCKYHDIGRYSDHMYVVRYAHVVRICISHRQKSYCVVHVFRVAQTCNLDERSHFSVSYW